MAIQVKLSEHAVERMGQMGVTCEEVGMAFTEPETVYPGSRQYRDGRTCYQRGRIVAVVRALDGLVITVLWHRAEGRDQGGR